ncbi:MAG: hypothetical protein WC728_01700 [Elusimicrobiota bacterium]
MPRPSCWILVAALPSWAAAATLQTGPVLQAPLSGVLPLAGPSLAAPLTSALTPNLGPLLPAPGAMSPVLPSLTRQPVFTPSPALLPASVVPSYKGNKITPAAQAPSAQPTVLDQLHSAAQRLPSASMGFERSVGDAFETFDGGRREAAASFSGRTGRKSRGKTGLRTGVQAAADAAWRHGGFTGSGGTRISYKSRIPAGAEGKPPTVFVGGLALAESFEPYFSRFAPEAGQFTLWLRGLPPSPWSPGARVFDADALDLARLIVLAGRESGSDRVDLALHSYSTMLFQRLLGLSGDPLAAEALRYLRGAKVTLFMGSTHYEGVERDMDPMSSLKLQVSKAFVDMIDMNDAIRSALWDLARWNPFLLPMAAADELAWDAVRALLLSSGGQDVARDLKRYLGEPWEPDIEPVRKALLRVIDDNSGKPGWQEAALRRFVDLLRLDFAPEHVRLLRDMGVRLHTVAAVHDDILPWALQRRLLTRLGIEAPARAPRPGTVLTDKEGLFRLSVVDSDHFYPLREPDRVRDLLRD